MYEPHSVIIRLLQGELGETMSCIRTWLDSEKIQSSGFASSAGAMGYTFTIGFRSIIDADRFRAQFGMPHQVKRDDHPGSFEVAAGSE